MVVTRPSMNVVYNLIPLHFGKNKHCFDYDGMDYKIVSLNISRFSTFWVFFTKSILITGTPN